MGKFIEIHAEDNGSGGRVEERIRVALESCPHQVVVVWCRDERQADSISMKMSRKELEFVQYAWRVGGGFREN